MGEAEKILIKQRHEDLSSNRLWVGEIYIHFESRLHVELASIGGDFVVLKNREGETLPSDFRQIWDRQNFINEFVPEFSMNRTHDMFS